jgi:hypothetical protein
MKNPRQLKIRFSYSRPPLRKGRPLGIKHTEETKNTLSKKASERYKDPKNNPMYGKTQSEETIKLMREAHKNREYKECPHCGKIVSGAMYSRWHGNKCKLF